MLKAYKRRYRSSKFRNFTDVCQLRPQGAFLWLLPTSKASEKRPRDEVGRLQMARGTNFHKLVGATSSLTYDVFLSKLASLQILRRSFKWCRWIFLLPGPGRVSTLSVPGFHMQGHCNTRKIYTCFNKGCFGIWTFKHRIQCNALLE